MLERIAPTHRDWGETQQDLRSCIHFLSHPSDAPFRDPQIFDAKPGVSTILNQGAILNDVTHGYSSVFGQKYLAARQHQHANLVFSSKALEKSAETNLPSTQAGGKPSCWPSLAPPCAAPPSPAPPSSTPLPYSPLCCFPLPCSPLCCPPPPAPPSAAPPFLAPLALLPPPLLPLVLLPPPLLPLAMLPPPLLPLALLPPPLLPAALLPPSLLPLALLPHPPPPPPAPPCAAPPCSARPCSSHTSLLASKLHARPRVLLACNSSPLLPSSRFPLFPRINCSTLPISSYHARSCVRSPRLAFKYDAQQRIRQVLRRLKNCHSSTMLGSRVQGGVGRRRSTGCSSSHGHDRASREAQAAKEAMKMLWRSHSGANATDRLDQTGVYSSGGVSHGGMQHGGMQQEAHAQPLSVPAGGFEYGEEEEEGAGAGGFTPESVRLLLEALELEAAEESKHALR
ncbi:unnamed protein product [Closterium sp. Yama58-4]|nr:unnamed protein product [Closterium sp. Yama58-4]